MQENNRPEQENNTPVAGNDPIVMTADPIPQENKGRKRAVRVVALCLALLLVAGGGVTAGLLAAKDRYSAQSPQENTDYGAGITIHDTPKEETSLPQDGTLQKLSSVQVAQKMMPSVVGIVVYQKGASGKETQYSSGSGVIMSEDGYILTCSHVVKDGNVTGHIEVLFTDDTAVTAQLVGFDTQTDLAVIRVNKTGLTPAEFGDSGTLLVGEPVYVIGAPSGIEYIGSFAGGFVSAVDREITVGTQKYKLACIQTDAAINPGNSGGPLINEYGQVVGINSAKLVSTNVEGMGFAIPSNTVQSVVASLLESGYVTGRPRIGITFTSISEEFSLAVGIPQGVRVVGIDESCDVAKKDVQIGDIITAVDGEQAVELSEIAAILNRKKPGDTLTLRIYRVNEKGDASTFDVDIILAEKTQ